MTILYDDRNQKCVCCKELKMIIEHSALNSKYRLMTDDDEKTGSSRICIIIDFMYIRAMTKHIGNKKVFVISELPSDIQGLIN